MGISMGHRFSMATLVITRGSYDYTLKHGLKHRFFIPPPRKGLSEPIFRDGKQKIFAITKHFSRMRSEGFPFIVGGLGVGPVFAASWSARRFRDVFRVVFATFFASFSRRFSRR